MNALVHRGAAIARGLRLRKPAVLRTIGGSLYRALAAAAERRAARELWALADRWEPFDPEVAQQLRQAARRDAGNGHDGDR